MRENLGQIFCLDMRYEPSKKRFGSHLVFVLVMMILLQVPVKRVALGIHMIGTTAPIGSYQVRFCESHRDRQKELVTSRSYTIE